MERATSARRRTIVGLYKEIRDNSAKLRRFPPDAETRDRFKALIRADRAFRPLLVVQESSKFYDLSAGALPDIHSSALLAISEFYNFIAEEVAIVRAFESAAFPTISDEGRAGLIDDLWEACTNARHAGEVALAELEQRYPRRWFKRFR